eukprot:Sdes_comp20106_c0_seq1m13121
MSVNFSSNNTDSNQTIVSPILLKRKPQISFSRTKESLSIFNQKFLCPICHQRLTNPFTIQSCNHHFCETCIQECLDVCLECPVCRLQVWRKDLTKNFFLNQVVTYLNVLDTLLLKTNVSSQSGSQNSPLAPHHQSLPPQNTLLKKCVNMSENQSAQPPHASDFCEKEDALKKSLSLLKLKKKPKGKNQPEKVKKPDPFCGNSSGQKNPPEKTLIRDPLKSRPLTNPKILPHPP